MDKNIVCAAAGAAAACVTSLFGGWNGAIMTLLTFMGIDYVMGLIAAAVFHVSPKSENGRLESRAGWKGLVRKGATLAVVLASCRLDMLLNTSYIKDAVVIAFCANELISIIENAGIMGVPVPTVILDAIDLLKGKAGGGANDSNRSNQ